MFRYLILGLLRNGAPLHGYALVKAYRDRSGVEVRTGNFYRELRRLMGDELISCAQNPRGMDERRTPYAITAIGREVFEEWLNSPQAGRGESFDDEISARALFLGDSEPSAAAAALEHLRVNLWVWGKRLERERAVALNQAAGLPPGSGPTVLPLLLARRLKQAAADIELVEGLSELTDQRLASDSGAARNPPALAMMPPPERAARRRGSAA
ncbi:MAG: PadR family transcriptional regulator [bacterium]